MACNARDTPKGYNRDSHWRHPPDSLIAMVYSARLALWHLWLVYDCLINLFTAEASFAWLPWQDRRGLQHYLLTQAKHRRRVVRRISLQNQRRVAMVRHYQSREITQRWHKDKKDKQKSRISDWPPNLSETWGNFYKFPDLVISLVWGFFLLCALCF